MNYSLSDDTWDEKELLAIQKVLDSGHFTMGDRVKVYEEAFAKKFGSKFAVMSNSGSSANLLAISALVYSGRLNAGDEVIVPAVSWSTTFFPVSQCGLKLRFVDIDIDTLNIDLDCVENAITDNTKAIFVVNLLGNPNYFDRIQEICNKYGLMLIEDNCESMGARYKEKYAGTFGILGTFSTFYSHHICTMEGGMTITNDEELYHYMLAIRAHGWTRQLPQNSNLHVKSDDDFYESFNFVTPGYNLRPLELEAAIGFEQLKKCDDIFSTRRKNAAYFKKSMNLNDFITQKEVDESSWFGFSIVLTNKLVGKRNILVDKCRKNGIEVRPIVAGNFTKQSALKYLQYSISGNLDNADNIHENGLFIGNHSKVIYDKIDFFMSIVEDVEKQY